MKIKRYLSENSRQITLFLLIIISLGSMLYLYGYDSGNAKGPEQPVPFSHRVHANDKMIGCVFCHDGATKTSRAGIPPVQTCMLCHEKIIIHHPEIEKLRAIWNSGKTLEWIKIAELPDFVFFNHSVHIFRQIDCSECHGNVRQMDRLKEVYDLKMEFCIDCHRKKNASMDCFKCHR